jgi:two-component system CheB/CheR fusion protein
MTREPDVAERPDRTQATPSIVVLVAAAGRDEEAATIASRLPPDAAAVILGVAAGEGGRLAPGSVRHLGEDGAAFVGDAVIPAADAREHPVARTVRSLTAAFDERAVAIVLGAVGEEEREALVAVHRAGGLALSGGATAGFTVEAGSADDLGRMLTVDEMAAAIAEAARRWNGRPERHDPEVLAAVLDRLERHAGPSVRHFKPALLARRVGRRIALTGASGIREYLGRLDAETAEADALSRDLLIGITRFFRDAEVWRTLGAEVVPQLVAARAGGTIRLWVAGASTGEEAYSYAILLADEMDRQGVSAAVTIFATDIDAAAIDTARTGLFDAARAADFDPEMVRRHFVADGASLRISQRLREMIVFAVQDVVRDPPFPEIDLVSCRNVLIHLDSAAQRRAVEALSYALAPRGVLVLGESESPGEAGERFATVSAEARIYRKDAPARAAESDRPAAAGATWPDGARRALLDLFVPPAVIVGRDLRVRYVHGAARDLLAIPEGEPTSDLLQLVDRRLRESLRTALERAAAGEETRGLAVADDVPPVSVRTIPAGGETLFLVSFGDASARGNERLAVELAAARAELQSTVEELESANEELKAANEEVTSGNLALQRANSELEVSRDALGRVNERLSATNAALENTVAELKRSNGDLATLLSGIDVATLFLDRHLAVRRYTPRASEVFGLRPGDVGRPLDTVALAYDDATLIADAHRVLDRLAPVEREVKAGERWLMRRIVPDRTADHVIAGVLVTAWDVTALKETADRLARRERQQAAIATLGEAATSAASTIQAVLDRAAALVAEHLDVPLVKVLELAPGWDHLSLRAGAGWRDGLVGTAHLPADAGSQGGFTLRSGAPVLVEDLATERRFAAPQLLLEHGAVSGLTVTIGPTDSPWGVIGAHSARRRHFTADDISFLQAIANVVYATIERQRVARAYRIAAERLELAVGVGGLATWDWDIDSDETVWSENHYTMLGYRKAEVRSTFEAWRSRVHPDDVAVAEGAIAAALAGDGNYVCEYRIVPQPGVERWVEGRGRTARDPAGRPVRMFGVLIDVTERKRSEERQTLLLNELDHRVRNILANITALARQTRGRAVSIDGYVADFTERLAAIGRAHTLLSEARWGGASLATLLEEEVAAQRRSKQVVVEGPHVVFGPDDAQLFALAFHELAANAVRHGALRSPGGRLSVRWWVETIGGEENLLVDWIETGETPVEAPRGEGFGLLVLKRLIPVQTDSDLTLAFEPEGLHCRILIPRGRVEVAAARRAAGPAGDEAATVSLEGRRILIVEDSMLTALDIESMLRDEGAVVVGIASTVEEAQQRLSRGGIDAALLDRNLAGTMVDDAARALVGAGVPFAFMTGYNTQAIPPDLRHVPVLNKPFEAETLRTVLATVL